VNDLKTLEVSDLSVKIGSSTILHNISFMVNKGSSTAIIGPSGSGKSTLLNALINLCPISSGDIIFNPDEASSKFVGFVPQVVPDSIPLNLSVSEIVSLGSPRLGLFTSKTEKTKTDAILDLLQLSGLQSRLLPELSGGQRQRVMIARALMTNSSLLVLDEPTSGADPFLVEEIMSTLSDLTSNGVTVILSTHDVDRIVTRCDYIVALQQGKLIYSGSSKNLDKDFFDKIYTKRTS